MSEYQYYEFQAIDRPLDTAAQRALRAITSRAEITAHSLINTYQWGDFKGDPRRLMEDWFDLFVYWANWGSRRVMLGLPRRFLDPAAVRPYEVPEALEAWGVRGDRTVLEFLRAGEALYGYADEEGLSAAFAALRFDLLRGDRRCLYLGWLLGVQDGLVDDDAVEPPRPAGLAEPSGTLAAFTEFFALDRDLLEAAAEGDADAAGVAGLFEPSPDDLDAFIAGLPEAEKTALLRRAVLDADPHLGIEVRRRWAVAAGRAGPEASPAPSRRTAEELRAAAEARYRERARLAAEWEAAERARRAEEERLARERHLDRLAARPDEAWREVDLLAETKRPGEYKRAVALLKDLREVAERTGSVPDFCRRLEDLRERHRRKPSLLARIDAAGLAGPDDPALAPGWLGPRPKRKTRPA